MNNLIININKILKENYPLEISFNKIDSLSHFWISNNNYDKFFPFNINIDGMILKGEYKNYKIIQVKTTKTLSWKQYILLYVSLLNISLNPCVNENKFIRLLHSYNYIDFLNIHEIKIKKNKNIIDYKIEYKDTPSYNLSPDNKSNNISNKDNHFYLESFQVNRNYEKLKIEIDRLIKNRDKYKTIHFHLNNNGGGDIVAPHLILRCLVGNKKEKWMKNIKKIIKNKEILEWDCWAEETKDSPNYSVVQKLNLDNLPNYDTKYNGKIYLHMNKKNGSAVFYFITYLIYAFSTKINRYSEKCYGQTIKYGSIESDQLILLGHSGTSSGDGNAIQIKLNDNITVNCPTQQFISSSIKKSDYNRFWIE
jgi:hypothetical protein